MSTVTFGNVTYTLNSGSYTASVSGNALEERTDVTIPPIITYDSVIYTVTSIGNRAFSNSPYLASIVIPETVTTIANGGGVSGTFSNCSALTAVTIGANVTTIGDYAFQGCSKLTAVIIPDAVTSIGRDAFFQCSELTAVTIGSSVTSIGSTAFALCSKLTSMYFLGDLPSSLGSNLFMSDNSLTLYYLDGATGWSSTVGGRLAVAITAGITGVASITAFSNSNKTATFSIADNSYTNVELVVLNGDSGVTSGKAFALSGGNWTVTSPALVDGDVVKVFLQTSSGAIVTQLLSYDSTATAEDGIIYYSVDLGVGIVSIGNDAFVQCTALTAVTIGANVTTIGNYAFYRCSALTAVIIPDAVTSIGEDAFRSCSELTAVTIGANVTTIGSSAFNGCSKLTAVTIPNAVTSIGGGAFSSCSELTAVIIGASVTSIGQGAFAFCTELTSMYFLGDLPTSLGSDLFLYGDNSLILYYLDGATGWSTTYDYTTIGTPAQLITAGITGVASITNFNNSAKTATFSIANTSYTNVELVVLNGDSGVTSGKAFAKSVDGTNWTVTSPALVDGDVVKVFLQTSSGATVTQLLSYDSTATAEDGIIYYSVDLGVGIVSIGNDAFLSCTKLTAVTIGANVTTIGNSAFRECSALTHVTIGSSVTTIGNHAFQDCSALTAVTIPNAVTSIGDEAFYDCSELTAVMIGESVTSIGDYAFQGCSALTAVTISSENTTFFNGSNGEVYQISDSTVSLFFCPRDKTTFTIPDSVTQNGSILYTVTSIASLAFMYCSALTAVTIGANVTSIGDGAFTGCIALTAVTIPNAVTSIGQSAFESCSALTAVTIGANVTTIGDYAFYDCYALTAVTIPDAVTSIGQDAFYLCSALTAVTIGSGLTTMGSGAFQYCGTTLTSMYFLGDYPSGIDGTTFYGDNSLILYYLDGATGWSTTYDYTTIGTPAQLITAGITGVASITAFSNSNKTATFSIADNSYTNVELVVLNGDSGVTSGKAFAKSVDGTNWTVTSPALVDGDVGDVVKVFLQTSSGATVTQLLSYNSTTIDGTIYYSVDLGVGIVSIGDSAFRSYTALIAVTIGANVTTIGQGAFQECSELTAVIIPDAVTTIGNSAFSNCSELTAVTIGSSVTSIGGYAFSTCSELTAVTIGSGLTTMGSYAFIGCTELTSMYFLGDLPSSLGSDLFLGDDSLTLYYLDGASNWPATVGGKNPVAITAGITSVASITAFSNSNKTATFSIADNSYTNVELVVLNGDSGVTSGKAFAKSVDGTNWTVTSPALVDGDVVKVFLQTSSGAIVTQLLSYDSTATAEDGIIYYSVDLGVGIVSIGNAAFLSCTKLTAVTIGANVTTIGNSAFRSCSALTAVTIPDAVTSIGDFAFQSCSALTAVTIPDAVTTIGEEAFFQCSALTAVIIPDAVTSIGNKAFSNCSELTAVTIGASVTSIGNVAFAGCSKLTAVIIPDAVTIIGSGAFSSCSELTAVIIGASVTSIGGSAFAFCIALTGVTIPDAVTTIGNSAFRSCSALTSLPVSPNNTVLYNDPSDNGVIYQISNGVASLYLSVPTKVSYEMLSTIQDVNVTSVHSYAFYFDASLSHIVLSDSITQIGEAAFQNCTGLSNVVIPASVTTIGTGAFVADSALDSVYFLGDKPSTIGNYAFSSIKNPSTAYYLSSNAETWVTTPDGFTNLATFTISDLCVAGYTASELQTLGVADSDILGAGYSALDLKTAGYTIADLQGAGYSDNVILGAGYTATQLQGAGYTATQLQSAGYSATQLQSAGYSIADLQGAGYTDSAILGAGYSAAQLAAAGFYLISGTATGLSLGATFVLTLVINGDSVETKTIQATTSANNDFYFSNYVSSGSDYSVSATSSGKTATITNGSGIISTSNITDISIAFADNSTPTIPSSNVCFPAKTPILTNCGPINIEDIDPSVHTIRNKKIVAITKTVAHDKNLVRIAKHALGHLYPEKTTLISQNHKVFFQGQMVKAKHLVDQARGVTLVPYNGEILYNVLLEQYEKMQVNNLIVETLHPEHKVAKLYRFLQNVDVSHHGKLIALFNKKDKEHRIHLHL